LLLKTTLQVSSKNHIHYSPCYISLIRQVSSEALYFKTESLLRDISAKMKPFRLIDCD